VASGAVFIRLGNFMNSEIFGKVTSKDTFMAMKFVKGEDNLPPKVASQLNNIPDGNQAYNAIANEGRMVKPRFISEIKSKPALFSLILL
jgi:prolipoprotein diacylglyceryltransferase